MSMSTLLGVQAPLLAHSASQDTGFQLQVFPRYVPMGRLGRRHSQFMHALKRSRSPCAATPPGGWWPLTVPSTAWSDQAKGCNERGQCLAASQEVFLLCFSSLSSDPCFKSVMLLSDSYSSFVL